MKLTTLIVTGLAAAAVAVPVAGATNDRVQVAGSFVAPGQVAEALLVASGVVVRRHRRSPATAA
jgi:hypothetical protein